MLYDMRELMSITNALADQSRVRTLAALHRHGELCVCQIIELLALAPSTVSRHLALLHSAGLLNGRKQGRWMYYRLAVDSPSVTVRQAIQMILNATSEEPLAIADDRKLRKILCCSPEELCKIQTARSKAGAGSKCCSSAPEIPVEARSQRLGQEIFVES
jgi:DNA-binding transcriptional ArsR family regulator